MHVPTILMTVLLGTITTAAGAVPSQKRHRCEGLNRSIYESINMFEAGEAEPGTMVHWRLNFVDGEVRHSQPDTRTTGAYQCHGLEGEITSDLAERGAYYMESARVILWDGHWYRKVER